MTVKYAVTLKNSRLDDLTTAIGASGSLRIYNGTRPTNPDTALSGNTLLAQLPLSVTFAPGAASGVLTASAITADSSADATGTATFASLVTAGGTRKVDMDVGTSGSDLNFNTLSIVAGAQVSCSSMVITENN